MDNIRKARILDIIEIQKIDELIFGDDSYDEITYINYILNYNISYIYVLDKKIVGYLICEESDSNFSICSFGVLPEFQNKGIGTKLLKHIINEIETVSPDKKSSILLEVRVSNSKAIKLYKNFGFFETSVIKNYYPDGEDAYLMLKFNL